MITPIKIGDPLYPNEEFFVDGVRHVRHRLDWDREKQISLNIRTIEYHLQFPNAHSDLVVANMIDAYSTVDYREANSVQKAAYDHLRSIRESWSHPSG